MKRFFAAFFLLFVGCPSLPFTQSAVDRLQPFLPKVTFKKLNLKNVTFKQADTDFVFDVKNPNPLQVKLSSFRYQLDFEGQRVLSGDNPNGLVLAASGSSDIALPVTLVYEDLYKTIQAVKGQDDIHFTLTGEFGFMTPAGEAKIPFTENGKFPAPKVPKFSFINLKVNRSGSGLSQKVTGELQFKASNEHASKIDFKAFRYDIALNNRPAAQGSIPQFEPLDGSSERTFTLPIELNLANLGGGLLSTLTGQGSVDLHIKATLDVSSPFGVLPLTLDQKQSVSLNR